MSLPRAHPAASDSDVDEPSALRTISTPGYQCRPRPRAGDWRRLWSQSPTLSTRCESCRFGGAVAASHSRSIELIEGTAESIPLPDQSVDTIVTTWTMCSIPNLPATLSEMRRVLKADGRLLFAEPGRSPEANVERWQNRLTPLWKRAGGGCHLKIGPLTQ